MSNTFIISDTHFGHAGVCRFLCEDGSKLRPWDDPEKNGRRNARPLERRS